MSATSLVSTATAYAHAGLSVFAVAGKHPNTRVLPWVAGQDGKRHPSWAPYQSRIADDAELHRMFSHPDTTGLAVACGPASCGPRQQGGLYVIDVDRLYWVDPFLARCGDAAKRVVIQRTGRGGIQMAMIYHGADELRNQKIAMYENPEWRPDLPPDSQTLRYLCGIESRGFGGYACLAPSIHPNGNRYSLIQGSFESVPTIDDDTFMTILEAAQSLNEVMSAETHARATGPRERKQHRLNKPRLIIDTFTAEWGSIARFLETRGYTFRNSRRGWRPGAKPGVNMPGVLISDDGDAANFFSSNDPLRIENFVGGYFHDIFGAYVGLTFGKLTTDTVYDALEQLGQRYNIPYQRPDVLGRALRAEPPTPPAAPTTTPATIQVFGQSSALSVVFIVDSEDAARALENQGVAAVYVPRSLDSTIMNDLFPVIQRWPDRYVLTTVQDGLVDCLAETVSGKVITAPRGASIASLTGVDLLHLMQTARPASWSLGISALRRR